MKRPIIILLLSLGHYFTLFSQNQVAENITIEHQLSKPVAFSPFEQGEVMRGRHLAHVTEGTTFSIKEHALEDIMRINPATMQLLLPSPLHVELDLYQGEVFSHDFKLTTSDGQVMDFKNEALLYRGIIKNDKNSIAAVTITKDEILIMYSDREGNKRIQKTDDDTYIAFKDENIRNKPQFSCGFQDGGESIEAPIEPDNGNTRYTTEECATVFVVCDYASYQSNSSDVYKTYLWVAKLWNEVVTLYENEQIPVRVSTMYVYTTSASDPFKNLKTTDKILKKFKEIYNPTANQYGWFKHLMSTRESFNDGFAGLSDLSTSVDCNDTHNSFSGTLYLSSEYYPIYSWSVNILAHEMGHAIGSHHTHWCGWSGGAIDGCESSEGNCSNGPIPPKGTIMSYCHAVAGVGINFSLGFGPKPGNRIRSYFNQLKNNCNLGNCLTEGTQCADAVALPCGAAIQGNTTIASWDNAPQCALPISGPGMWFKFTGDGQNTIISTCESANFNTIINVYRGSCNLLICVAGNDDYCSQKSQVAFSTTSGTVYYVLVQGPGYGNFTITRTCTSGPNTNDVYTNATPIGCGYTLSGNTYWATLDNNVPLCSGTTIDAPGVWYKFTGNDQNVMISTCPQNNTFFARLKIYKLVDNNLVCVANNDGYCFPGSQVSFNAKDGIEYYILVHGFNNEKGDFQLKLNCVNLPPGDLCSNAIPLNCGASLSGNTLNASYDPEMMLCGYGSLSFTPGIWYTFTGDGQNATISTCHPNTNFGARLTVFSGQCDGLLCIGRDNQFCGSKGQITFPTIIGETYYIIVDGYFQQGSYTISRSCAAPASNDVCSAAILLPCASTIPGSTQQSANDPYVPSCGYGSSPGVWYKIIGSGEVSRISTCTQNNFDTYLQVFSGSCFDLSCLGSNNNYCGLGSQVSISTEVDSIYYVLVNGYGSNGQGDFQISHDCTEPIEGDECETAIYIPCDTTLLGNTSLASFDPQSPQCSNTFNNSSGIWYKFIGNGKITEISVTGLSGFDSQISVYSGACNGLDCVTGDNNWNDNTSFVSFITLPGIEYYIKVHGFYSQGEFSLSRSCKISSDVCSSAIEIQCGETLTGTSVNSTIDNLPVCNGQAIQSGSVWYKIAGNGQVNEISVCSMFDYDTKISVYKNQYDYTDDCDVEKICVTSNDDFCGLGSRVSFPTLDGAKYFILVSGYDGATGDFEISRTCITTEGDNCGIAIALNCDETLSFSNIGALGDDNLPDCFGMLPSANKGIWYTFYGNDKNNIISTCTNATFDTRLRIYAGSCANLVCIAANDNYCENKSIINFYAALNTQYFVLLDGTGYGGEPSGGNYTITRSCHIPPPNDFAEQAIVIDCGQTKSGSLANAGADTDTTNCGNINSVGLWYKFTGTGDNTYFTFTGTTLKRVYIGHSNQLRCYSTYGFSNSFSFTTRSDSTYYIFIEKNPSTQDNFSITRACSASVANDLCHSAIELQCGISVNGTTIGAAVDKESKGSSLVCSKSISYPGVWYRFTGDGQNVDIEICANNNFYPEITVFQNDCDELICVGDEVSYYFCGTGSRARTTTVAGREYYVLVHSYNSTTGNFSITRNCVAPSTGNNCSNAININCGQTLNGTTIGLPYPDPEIPSCLSNECCMKQQGVWFKLTGNNQVAKISTCTNNAVSTNLHIYKYDCSYLTCVDWSSFCYNNDYGSEVTFLAEEGQQYYVFVERSQYTDPGPYSITYTCETPSEGTTCSTAKTLSCGQSVSESTHDSWPAENLPFCGFGITSKVRWYKFTGDGENTIIFTCSGENQNTNTVILLYEGNCDDLNCVAGNDDYCGLKSSISLQTTDNVEYYVAVATLSYSSDFEITRSCANVSCSYAFDLPCNTEISGSIFNALTPEDLPYCGSQETGPGVWYKFTGDDQNTTINTCTYYDFDTRISVYTGNCSEFNCVTSNDNFCGFGSQVSFNTIAGNEYFVFIHSGSSSQGDFTLKRTCDNQTSYCQSSGIFSESNWISEINLNGYQRLSGSSSYSYFSNDTISLSRGGSHEISLGTGTSSGGAFSPVFHKIWIDFNHDGIFEANEVVLNNYTDTSYFSGTILIPPNVQKGITRMRVSLNSLDEPMPCDAFWIGEVEDYLVNIKCNLVTSTNEEGNGSLRYVANCVDRGEAVLFSPVLDNEIIQITNSPIEVIDNWKWKADSSLNITITSENILRAINIPAYKSLEIEKLKIYGGMANQGSVIENNGILILRNCGLYATYTSDNVTLLNYGILKILGNCLIK